MVLFQSKQLHFYHNSGHSSHASIGSAPSCDIFSLHLFTRTAKLAWKMLTRLPDEHGDWLHVLGFGQNQR